VTAAITQLEYDGQGLLLRITENENVRHLVRDRADSLARPLVEMDAMTNAIRQFVWANGKLLAQVAGNGTIRVAHSDELGRILALTDANGVLTDEYAYQPYGRLIARSGTNDLPFAFMGDYGVWSAGNGLYLTRHRAYDANLMRFLQPDPIGLKDGYNLYTYANGAPSVFIDPIGLWTLQIGLSFSGGIGFGGTIGFGVAVGYSHEYGFQGGVYGFAGVAPGTYTGAGAGGTIDFTWSGNPHISNISGAGAMIGGSVTALGGPTIGGEATVPLFGSASSSYTGSAGIGVGTPEFHTFLGGTAVGQVFGMPNNPAGQSSGTPNGSSTFQVIGRK